MRYSRKQINDAKRVAQSYGVNKLGNVGANSKTIKSDKKTKYLTWIMYLAPSNVSGVINMCPSASPGCAAGCLNTSGRGRYGYTQLARIRKTKFFAEQRDAFKTLLWNEIYNHQKRSIKLSKIPAVRINGTSDIVIEKVFPELFIDFPKIQFYDYTKILKRVMPSWDLPKNYHLTFSRSEINDSEVEAIIRNAPLTNVAVVFDKLPKRWKGRDVQDGDRHDLRPLDRKGVIVGLKAKGRARKDKSGFVVSTKGNTNINLTIIKKPLVTT